MACGHFSAFPKFCAFNSACLVTEITFFLVSCQMVLAQGSDENRLHVSKPGSGSDSVFFIVSDDETGMVEKFNASDPANPTRFH